jgi:hypothetical protein
MCKGRTLCLNYGMKSVIRTLFGDSSIPSCLHMFGVLHGAKAEGESYALTALHSRPHQVGPHRIILQRRGLFWKLLTRKIRLKECNAKCRF